MLALLGLGGGGGGGGGAAGPAVKQLAEKAGEKEGTAAEETAASRAGNIVYRGGSDTPRNLTPRHPDDTVDTDQPGLSTYRTAEQAMGETSKKAQVIDLNRLTNLKWVEDAAGHVSILPKTAKQLLESASTRGTETVHPYTREVFEAIIDVVRR